MLAEGGGEAGGGVAEPLVAVAELLLSARHPVVLAVTGKSFFYGGAAPSQHH